jgi:hypothetical protein
LEGFNIGIFSGQLVKLEKSNPKKIVYLQALLNKKRIINSMSENEKRNKEKKSSCM